ncbi:EDD domain protein [Salimicrobium jeotgali]|uniref:DegV family protein n=1 Tax=Salimicrobium jeotgali TaxID=1230341 RepID=K2GPS7_9BACI|nr:DegV family protein [Salimicrobium jeotgali]AKG05225.1 EDD domain protein [Salimicrobium jeotgali]EKE32394.1 DegV family protein [Salimicrobium jeotgali]MBM7695627.1 DegV family protein with EDD domain [Salimicrobium jeotgali]
MKEIILSTESCADLPKDLRVKYNLYTVPMHIIMDDRDYPDGSLPVEEIYNYYERTKSIPSTTATNIHEYEELFTEIRKTHPGCAIVHIGYTSKASSSFQNAVIATEEFEDVHLIDALNVTGGLAAVVLRAAEILRNEPETEAEELMERIEQTVPKARLSFIPGSLEFLKAGGRVSNAGSLIGTLLKIKPRIDLKNGKLISTKKYRGNMKGAGRKLLHDYFSEYDMDPDQLYFIYSVGLDEETRGMLEQIAENYGFRNIRWIQAVGMISTHSGPGDFGVAGLEK